MLEEDRILEKMRNKNENNPSKHPSVDINKDTLE